MAPSVLAKKIADGHSQSSMQLAEQLGAEYSWTSEERRQKVTLFGACEQWNGSSAQRFGEVCRYTEHLKASSAFSISWRRTVVEPNNMIRTNLFNLLIC